VAAGRHVKALEEDWEQLDSDVQDYLRALSSEDPPNTPSDLLSDNRSGGGHTAMDVRGRQDQLRCPTEDGRGCLRFA
jgi:hypothetical protein